MKNLMIIKSILCYIFLYLAFIYIFYDIAYNIYLCWRRHESLTTTIIIGVTFCILYIGVNHLLVSRVVGKKTVVLIETIFFATIVILIISHAMVRHYFYMLAH